MNGDGKDVFLIIFKILHYRTRPDTWLPQSRAGGQGPYLRSLDHLGRSSEAKDRKKIKIKCDGQTDGWTDQQTDGRTDGRTDGPTKRGVESRSTRLKSLLTYWQKIQAKNLCKRFK